MSTGLSLALFVGRALFAVFFLFSGRGHIQNHARFTTAAKGKIPLPEIAGWPVGIWLALGGVSVLLGVFPEVGSLMLIAFLIPAAVIFHPYWTFSDPTQRRPQQSNFFRNLTLIGAALALFSYFTTMGAGQFALTGPLVRLH